MDTPSLLFAATRALHIGCALLLVSVPLFIHVIARPAQPTLARHERFYRRLPALLWGLLVVEVLTGAAWLGFVAASMTDEPSGWPTPADLWLVCTGTRFGWLWLVRAGLAVLLGSLFVLQMIPSSSRRRFSRALPWIALFVSAALLGSMALAGHGGSDARWPTLHLTVDLVHVLAGAVWPFGLVPLSLFLIATAPARGATMDVADVAVVQRYSSCAFFAVLALVASGAVNGWLMLPSWDSLFRSLYGKLLLVKTLIVLLMIALGALNRFRFLPGLTRDTSLRLVKTVVVETGLAFVVILIVGVMGLTAPGP